MKDKQEDRPEIARFDKVKTADILLVICPLWDIKLPPMGISYLYSYLKSKGHKPLILDMNIDLFNRTEHKGYWLEGRKRIYWAEEEQFDELYQQFEDEINLYVDSILSSSVPIVAFSINEVNRFFSVEIAKRIKEEDGKRVIIFGGVGVSIAGVREETPPYPVDIHIFGEGEFTLEEVVRTIKEKGEITGSIPGAIVNREGNLSQFTPREPIERLGDIPFPTFENLPLNQYRQYQQAATLPLLITRGCRCHCAFCSDYNYLGPFRKRPMESVIEELNFHIQNNGAHSFDLFDLAVNNDIEHLKLLCQAIIESGLKIPWMAQAIAKREMDYDLLGKMKKAGCVSLTYGIESGSDRILGRMRKPFTSQVAEKVIRLTEEVGIKVQMNIIVGFPGETEKEFNETCEFVKRCSPYISAIGAFNVCSTMVNSDLFKNFKEYGITLSVNSMGDITRWVDANGNGVSFRVKNGRKFLNILNELNIPIHDTNLDDPHMDDRDWLRGEGIFPKTEKEKEIIMLRSRLEKIEKEKVKRLKKVKKINGGSYVKDEVIEAEIQHHQEKLVLAGILDGSKAFTGPEIVQFDVTNRCNNNCLCCWMNSPLLGALAETMKNKREQELPLSLVRKVIEELHELGTRTLLFAGGGEPFLHPHFMEILECAKENKMGVHLNTNFTLIDEEKIEKLVELKIDLIHVSLLAGSSRTYARIHPNKTEQTFLRLKERLKYLARLKASKNQRTLPFPYTNLYYVIFNTNYDEIKPMVDLALEVKANGVEFTPMDTVPGKTEVLLLNDLQRKEVLREVKIQNKRLEELNRQQGGQITLSPRTDSFIKRLSSEGATRGEYETNIVPTRPCYVGWAFARILANGNVIPCLKAYRIPVGNIYQQPFKDIWNSEGQQLFRKKIFKLNGNEPYLKMIGNKPGSPFGCLKSCDNIQVNLEMHEKYKGRLESKCRKE